MFLTVENIKARSHGRLNRRDSVATRLAWITGCWATSDCVFKHSATANWKRVCCQNDKILPNSSNYLFKRTIQSLRLTTGCQILNTFKVNRWLLRHHNSVAATNSCALTQASTLLVFLQWRNCGDSVAPVNGPLDVNVALLIQK